LQACPKGAGSLATAAPGSISSAVTTHADSDTPKVPERIPLTERRIPAVDVS
jgi:hypothetical protein